MSDYEKKIERGLILFLREEHEISARTAKLCESEIERGWSDGCDTCGYGADEDKIYFRIYWTDDQGGPHYLRKDGPTLSFFPELLSYIDRAN